MFGVHCDHLDRDVLVDDHAVTGMEHAAGIITLYYRCWCGAPGYMVTGRRGRRHSGHVAAA